MFDPTRIASPQGALIPFTPQASLVVSPLISQASGPSSHEHATAGALRVSARQIRSASFPTDGKVIMTRFVLNLRLL